ncbi:hypothetical protein GCM10025859_53050 [Alicyclobacillus fastidiosus]|nr:hypothetical protein GCM10025859_53050 [Alicyclobacillus fastidiosus]
MNIMKKTRENVLSNHIREVLFDGCPLGLVNATYKNGTPLVKGKNITAFTDDEEGEVKLDQHMPFLLETTLRTKGGLFSSRSNWTDYSVRDGNLVTGQNPQSSKSTAEKVVDAIENQT